jgi:hypothetical protein
MQPETVGKRGTSLAVIALYRDCSREPFGLKIEKRRNINSAESVNENETICSRVNEGL